MTEPTDAELQALWAASDHPLPQNFARAVLAKWAHLQQWRGRAGGVAINRLHRRALSVLHKTEGFEPG